MHLDLVVVARKTAHAQFVQEALVMTDPDVPFPEELALQPAVYFDRLWSMLRWKTSIRRLGGG